MAGVCTAQPDCERSVYARGWCRTHYRQLLGLFGPRKFCSIPNCDSPQLVRGWCRKHYRRWQKHGDPLGGRGSPAKKGEPARFIQEEVIPFTGDDCLTWPYGKNRAGYGSIGIKGTKTTELVHRFVCEAVHGPPPTPKMEAAHSCGKGHEGCVNPRHLRWATSRENSLDNLRHGTFPTAKLTEAAVREIRASSASNVELGRRYGVGKRAISRVRSRKTWKHVD